MHSANDAEAGRRNSRLQNQLRRNTEQPTLALTAPPTVSTIAFSEALAWQTFLKPSRTQRKFTIGKAIQMPSHCFWV